MECDTADNAERNADASGGKKRVFLVDDHEVVRRGVADMLESTGEFVVVGEAGTVTQALDRLQGLAVDVAVLECRRFAQEHEAIEQITFVLFGSGALAVYETELARP